MTLTKLDMVESVSKQIGWPKTKFFEIVETLLEIIKKSLEYGEDVLISGFGKFCVKKKKERRGRNPATSEDMMLAPRKIVTFKWSRQLKNKVNQ